MVLLFIFIYSVNIKPPRHRFGLSLCLGLAILQFIKVGFDQISCFSSDFLNNCSHDTVLVKLKYGQKHALLMKLLIIIILFAMELFMVCPTKNVISWLNSIENFKFFIPINNQILLGDRTRILNKM